MKREILCRGCAAKQVPMHPEDAANGFHRRIVPLQVQKPVVHGVEVITDEGSTFHPLRSIVCDHCDEPIMDGDEAVAVTWWNEHREAEPGPWEEGFRHQ